ncbi:MAG: NrfD/PsrC family molybdoenzyme membrane anchor subunit [bacterium]
MSKKILYREVNGNNFGFVALLAVLGALVALGAWAFFSVEHTGHYVTGMDNQIVWGMPHVFAITLIVAASGALNIGSIGTVFGKKAYQPLGRLSAVLAIALLIGGLAILVLDLGRPDRLIIAMTYYNFKSIFAWNIILYNGFIAIVGFYIWTMMDRKMKGFYKPAGTFAFIWRLILTLGTGSIFGFLVARQYYDAAIMGPLFIAMSFAMGLAIFNLVLVASYTMTGRELGNVIINKLRYLLAVFIGGVVLLELARHLTQLYATEHHGIEAFILMGDNIYSQLFWYGFVLVGTVLPLFLIFCTKLKNSRLAFMGASLMVIVGYVAQIYVILIGGQAYPLELFPNATVESVYFDGTINEYLPSLHEILLGVGGIGISLLVVAIAVSVLRVLPESLADKSVDPHHNK